MATDKRFPHPQTMAPRRINALRIPSTLLILSSLIALSFAATSSSSHKVGFKPVGDAIIEESSPDINYGKSKTLEFLSSPTDDGGITRNESLLKFDISVLLGENTANAEDGLISASLSLFVKDGCNLREQNIPVMGFLQVGLAEEDVEWEEMEVTWASAPELSVSSDTIAHPLTALEPRSWFDLDVTSFLAYNLASHHQYLSLRIFSLPATTSRELSSISCSFASRNLRGGRFSPMLSIEISNDEGPNETSAQLTVEDMYEKSSQSSVQGNSVARTRSSPGAGSECAPQFQLRQYSENEVASNMGSNYSCKPFPYTNWCGLIAYKPGESSHWDLAWELVGECSPGDATNADPCSDTESKPMQSETIDNKQPTKRPTRRPNRRGSKRPTKQPAGTPPALNSGDPLCGPLFELGHEYGFDDIVSYGSTNYACKIPTWCGLEDFDPTEGKFWDIVWDVDGPCTMMSEGFGGDQPSGNPPPEPKPTPPKPEPTPPAPRPGRNPRPKTRRPTAPPTPRPSTQLLESKPSNGGNVDPCPPAWVEGRVYTGNSIVESQGETFSCKGFPHSGWCSLSYYEPGKGTYWMYAWDLVGTCGAGLQANPPAPPPTKGSNSPPTRRPSRKPTKRPTPVLAKKPSPPTQKSTPRPTRKNNGPPSGITSESAKEVFRILQLNEDRINNEIFLYQGTGGAEPSTVYRYDGFIAGLEVMHEFGVAGKVFYLGDDSPEGHLYGLTNLAAFLGQSMKETIQYDACDENSWDLVDGRYPLSNACGQLGQSYQDYHCPDDQKHMECPVDPDMEIMGVTHAKWYGAPGPLFCGPKTQKRPFTGFWDYTHECHNPWADPPKYCKDYEGQKAGRYDHSEPVANNAGRTDVEGCCWWGRGVIQTTGVCNFGKLNYFLGKRAADEGRPSRYPKIDFCKDPEIICSSKEFKELKWIAGMFYWVESLQSYNERGWDYIKELHKFVDGGMKDNSFINAVSGIVNRGCHDPPCGTGAVDGLGERADNFEMVLTRFMNEPPTRQPTPPSRPPTLRPTRLGEKPKLPGQISGEQVFRKLKAAKKKIDNELFLYQGEEPSTVYRFEGFIAGLEVMTEFGVAGKYFYMGDDSTNGHRYGLANLAAFIGQSMKETIQYDACDENSWDIVDGRYPLSNACGQLGQSYQDYHCPDDQKHMECPVDPDMEIMGVTHAKWYGAPGPLFCGPKTQKRPFTGFWDYTHECHKPWADPPEYCPDYEGQKAGRYDNSEPVANNAGRTDVEGCCWWGRGVIQTTGVCNFGKLNYFLGKRAADEGRPSRYPKIDFCKDPEIICSSKEFKELKWIAGMFYWVESLQSYNERGWDYIKELHKFVDGGMKDNSFINAVSGIVNRGCHDPPCGTGAVDGLGERAENFGKALDVFGA